jgi:hypothetical protein
VSLRREEWKVNLMPKEGWILEENWFISLEDAKMKIEAWRKEDNEHGPHLSLGDEKPRGFQRKG